MSCFSTRSARSPSGLGTIWQTSSGRARLAASIVRVHRHAGFHAHVLAGRAGRGRSTDRRRREGETDARRQRPSGSWRLTQAGVRSGPPDSDHDGLPDAWERRHGFSPSNPDDGPADADGYTNLEEFLNGTEPRQPRVPGAMGSGR